MDQTPYVQSLFSSLFVCFLGILSLYTPIGGGVYAYHVLSLSFQGFDGQSTILGFYGPDINTEMGMVIYNCLEHHPD